MDGHCVQATCFITLMILGLKLLPAGPELAFARLRTPAPMQRFRTPSRHLQSTGRGLRAPSRPHPDLQRVAWRRGKAGGRGPRGSVCRGVSDLGSRDPLL